MSIKYINSRIEVGKKQNTTSILEPGNWITSFRMTLGNITQSYGSLFMMLNESRKHLLFFLSVNILYIYIYFILGRNLLIIILIEQREDIPE